MQKFPELQYFHSLRSKFANAISRARATYGGAGVWLRGVDCGPAPPSFHHILRCKYNMTTDGSDCVPAFVRCGMYCNLVILVLN